MTAFVIYFAGALATLLWVRLRVWDGVLDDTPGIPELFIAVVILIACLFWPLLWAHAVIEYARQRP